MKTATKVSLVALGCAGVASALAWWLADHRRGMAWAVAAVRARFPDVLHLPASSLDRWLHEPARTPPQLVDARSADEFRVSHLAGAVRIDPESTAAAAISTLDTARPVVVYCSAGYRGAALARRLQNAGRREVWNLEGGIFAWANSGYPLVQDGQPAQRVHPYLRVFSRFLKPLKRG